VGSIRGGDVGACIVKEGVRCKLYGGQEEVHSIRGGGRSARSIGEKEKELQGMAVEKEEEKGMA